MAAFSLYGVLTFKWFFVCLNDFSDTLLYHNEGEETKSQEHQHPCPILLEFHHSSPHFCKNRRKTWSRACETVTLTEGFVFSSCRCSKQSVSRLLTVNWSEQFIRLGYFHICCGNNNTLLYACEVIHLIKKGVISPYVQE